MYCLHSFFQWKDFFPKQESKTSSYLFTYLFIYLFIYFPEKKVIENNLNC